MSRNLDVNTDMQVPVPIALDVFDAFTLEPEHSPGLGPGGNFDWRFAIVSGNFDLGAESGLNEINRDFAKQIVAVALENSMRFDVQDDVEVAGRPATKAGFAVAG